MNIDIKELEKTRTSLENRYDALEKHITSNYEKGNNQDALKLEKEQELIDEQLDLVDEIINNLENTPKLFTKFLELNKQYKGE